MTSYPTAKWVLDKAASVALLVLLSPVFAFLFVAMGLEMLVRPRDRGPWLYRERRISRGREFELLKFRTLRRDVLARIDSESHARMHEGDEAKPDMGRTSTPEAVVPRRAPADLERPPRRHEPRRAAPVAAVDGGESGREGR